MFATPPLTIERVKEARDDYGFLLEIFVSAFYHRVLRPGDAAIDAGANAGMHLFPMADAVGPTGTVVAYEPNGALAGQLQERAAREERSQVVVHASALHDRAGTMAFRVYPSNPGLSHLEHDGPDRSDTEGRDYERREVDLVRMDHDAPPGVAFIKSDLEGADFLGLRGAERILDESRPLVIFENGRQFPANQYGYSSEDFFAYFAARRYCVMDVHGLPLTPETWTAPELAYEYVAYPREYRHISAVMVFIHRFWHSALQWPIVSDWGDCAPLGRDLRL